MPTLGPRIGQGRTADIYAWDDERAIKLFHEGRPRASVELELRTTALARERGCPTPRVWSVETVGDRHGIILERLHGPPLTVHLLRRLWLLLAGADLLAELHYDIRGRSGVGLPDLVASLSEAIDRADRLSPAQRDRLQTLLAQLPVGDRICHGDLHPANILMARTGPVVIDWDNAESGNPLADFARTVLLLRFAALPPSWNFVAHSVAGATRDLYAHRYRRRYGTLAAHDRAEYEHWKTILLAWRISEDIPAERERLLAEIGPRLDRVA